ncbi:uncharacterized, partial [Tachysurus ichikawai]
TFTAATNETILMTRIDTLDEMLDSAPEVVRHRPCSCTPC